MTRLLLILAIALSACGDDICRHLDPDVRVFWTPEQKDACPGWPRRGRRPTWVLRSTSRS